MSRFTKAFQYFLMVPASCSFAFVAAADCIQPAVVNERALIAADALVSMRYQIMDPDAGRIAMQAAAKINQKEIDASIEQQVQYIRCIAGAGRNRPIVAFVTDDGAVFLQRGVLPGAEKDIAAN